VTATPVASISSAARALDLAKAGKCHVVACYSPYVTTMADSVSLRDRLHDANASQDVGCGRDNTTEPYG
jgi:hypothetical protein